MGIRLRRKAEARWSGNVERGSGRISLASGALDGPYSLRTRVEDEPHTNPEELIGAAHAGCFAMSLASLLEEHGYTPNEVHAIATVHLEEVDGGFSITRIELEVTGDVVGVDEPTFARLADEVKRTCPVSRALAGTEIVLTAHLASVHPDGTDAGTATSGTSGRVQFEDDAAAREVRAGVTELELVPAQEGSDLSMSVLRLGGGAAASVGAMDADTLLFVFEGSAALTEGDARRLLEVGTAVCLPAGTLAELEAGADGLALVCAQAGSGCDRHAALGEPASVVAVEEAEVDAATGSRTFQILFGPYNGSTRATLFVGYVPPGRAPWHFHQYDEIVWVWRGVGRFHLGQQVGELREGTAFRLAPREVHVVENVGDDHLVLLGLFTPAGNPAAAYLADAPPS